MDDRTRAHPSAAARDRAWPRRAVLVVVAALVSLGAAACGGGGGGATDPLAQGKQVYDRRCATCHGSKGQGFVGPAIGGDRMVTKYPNIADQIAVVTNGRNQMPAWGSTLKADEIEAVVRYTREQLGR